MKKLLLLSAFALLGFSSCNNDDDNDNNPEPTDGLQQIWTLVRVSGGFAGTTATFPINQIMWSFADNGTVIIHNNNTDTSKEDYFDSGTYPYLVKDNTAQIEMCPKAMEIDQINFSCYKIQNDSLILDNAPADGHTLVLVKAVPMD
ncbi:hypothetical protein R1T16_00405 [Flavobacterium sp. DG1-102-2]|uniref:hypothetical protein n=1 Tax=Flavobacterium sp. DG1-102-2 TaxID=3081663 RepID=UPI00294A2AEE|nr:hypothetical protein [Flavobacterium sp. DG1-102-2]MDV6166865.1 hypothetical protein [Flavobacterium sp. DG1-102-2]